MNNKILIIEDDLELRANLETILQAQDFYVSGVGSAKEFYGIVDSDKFDIVIVDIGLPDKNDFELVEYLCQETTSKIIIISARETVEDRVLGYGAGADIYFVKPVEGVELIAAINNMYTKICAEQAQDNDTNRWVFDQSTWSLTAPNNKRAILTSKEGLFISTVMGKGGNVVSRKGVLSALGYNGNIKEDGNALDVLIVRVRKKCKEKCSMDLPITTHRNRGYAFEETFTLI
jgi:DNA-binding response OmpR family regulator